MKETIQALWNGEICGAEGIGLSPECRKIEQLIARHYETLKEALAKDQKGVLEKYTDCMRELESLLARDAFAIGFSLGMRLSAEALTGEHPWERA